MNQKDFNVLWAFTTKKQSAYGTKIPDVDLTKAYPFLGPDMLERTPEIMTDEDEVGKGHEYPTSQEIELWDTKLKRSFYLTTDMAGWIIAFGLGAISSAQQAATTAYEHTGTPMSPAASLQLPVTSVVEQQTSGIKQLIRDLLINDFAISGEIGKRLMLETNLVGSGYVEDSTLSMPSLSAGSFLRMRGLTFQIGPSGSEVDESARVKKFEFKWENNPDLEDGYYPGSGLYRGRCELGSPRKASLNFTLLMDQNTTHKDHLENNDYLAAIITAQGALIESTYYHNLTITLPRLAYTALPIGVEGNKLAYNVECNVFYDATSGWPVEIKVMNTETAYLVAA